MTEEGHAEAPSGVLRVLGPRRNAAEAFRPEPPAGTEILSRKACCPGHGTRRRHTGGKAFQQLLCKHQLHPHACPRKGRPSPRRRDCGQGTVRAKAMPCDCRPAGRDDHDDVNQSPEPADSRDILLTSCLLSATSDVCLCIEFM